MARIVCLGEGMLELSGSDGAWRLGFGGDTLNTAIHLARAGHDVAYMTALGTDRFSGRLRQAWEGEGLDGSLILTHPTRQAGFYAISTDDAGEREFTYWRDSSAARAMFELKAAEAAMKAAAAADLLTFSLISLAILPSAGRERLIALAARARSKGARVAFDGNFRPLLWESRDAAQHWRDAAIAVSDIGLPTFEDEAALSDASSPAAVAAHWRDRGCAEVVVKQGSEGCLLPDGVHSPVPVRLTPLDTSGAGDAFNGGYLAARMRGAGIASAAAAGHALAGWAVMRRGAIPPRDEAAPY